MAKPPPWPTFRHHHHAIIAWHAVMQVSVLETMNVPPAELAALIDHFWFGVPTHGYAWVEAEIGTWVILIRMLRDILDRCHRLTSLDSLISCISHAILNEYVRLRDRVRVRFRVRNSPSKGSLWWYLQVAVWTKVQAPDFWFKNQSNGAVGVHCELWGRCIHMINKHMSITSWL